MDFFSMWFGCGTRELLEGGFISSGSNRNTLFPRYLYCAIREILFYFLRHQNLLKHELWKKKLSSFFGGVTSKVCIRHPNGHRKKKLNVCIWFSQN